MKGIICLLSASGLAGIGWVLDHLNNEGFIELDNDELLSQLDNYLLQVMKADINKNYNDFLHGAVGYGLYFLQRHQSTKLIHLKQFYIKALESLLDHLKTSAVKHEEGSKWMTSMHMKKENCDKKVCNLSLSHGMSSIISFLSELSTIPDFQNYLFRTYQLIN